MYLFVVACLWLELVLLRGMWDDGKWPAWRQDVLAKGVTDKSNIKLLIDSSVGTVVKSYIFL